MDYSTTNKKIYLNKLVLPHNFRNGDDMPADASSQNRSGDIRLRFSAPLPML
jgi:hypothetical protein